MAFETNSNFAIFFNLVLSEWMGFLPFTLPTFLSLATITTKLPCLLACFRYDRWPGWSKSKVPKARAVLFFIFNLVAFRKDFED